MKYDCVFDEALDDGAGESLEGAGGAGLDSFSVVLWMYFSKSVCSSLLEPFASGFGATGSGIGSATAMAAGGSVSASSATGCASDGSDGRRGLGGGSDSDGSDGTDTGTCAVDSGSCTGSSINESPKRPDVLLCSLLRIF